MKREDAKVKMKVVFGRTGGEKTIGEIIKLNPTKAKVKSLEERGNGRGSAEGSLWTVPYGLMEPYQEGTNKDEVVIHRGGVEIKVGETTFRSHYADGNPLWKVMKSQGRDSFLCEVQSEQIEVGGVMMEGDWVGTQKLFMRREIVGAINMSQMFAGMMNDHDRFYKALKVGQTIHYHHGFNQWVRCVVVNNGKENVLKPVALVGEWRDYDLPHRMRDGSIHVPYHPKKIQDGETMIPNFSNLWEAGCRGGNPHHPSDDPTKDTPVSLVVPPMTAEQERLAVLWQKVAAVHEAANSNEVNPEVILANIRRLAN